MVEGYVDLLYRDVDGLVIVDYKTDIAVEPEALAACTTQVASTRTPSRTPTESPSSRGVLLFLVPAASVEHAVLRAGTHVTVSAKLSNAAYRHLYEIALTENCSECATLATWLLRCRSGLTTTC